MYIPSYDFKLFKIPNFSPLEANEYGAMTQFSASTPLSYVDDSLSVFSNLINQNFQEPVSVVRERLRKVRDEADRLLKQSGDEDCKQGRNILGGCGPIFGSKPIRSDGEGTMQQSKAGEALKPLETLMNALPAGSGIFLIAIVIIILLLLFVRK